MRGGQRVGVAGQVGAVLAGVAFEDDRGFGVAVGEGEGGAAGAAGGSEEAPGA